MTTPNDPTMSHDSLDAVIAGYMLAVEAGEVPNRQELLERHPEHADALRAFFADLDRMDRVTSPLRIADGLEATGAVEANDRTALPTVRYFGDYELLEEIARGGMGIVFKARQVSLNRLVALKMILAGSFASSRDVQRFRSEAEAAANLDHPHIVPIFEVGEHEGQQYYTMKFIEGTSLAKHPQGHPRREVEDMVTVIRAVHHAHQHGILHRDLKPSNVLVDSSGTRLVTDFGLAKRLAAGDGSFTETGQVLGTPKYMAPEQAAGRKDLNVAADVYSLGVILYERITGQTPFTGENASTLLRQARESEPPRPSSIRPGLDRDLETVALKCLEKQPARRYPSAESLADDLDRWLRGEPILARPVGPIERGWLWCKRNPVVVGLTGAVAAALVIGTVVSTAFGIRATINAKRADQHAEAERRESVRANQAARKALEEKKWSERLRYIAEINAAAGDYEAGDIGLSRRRLAELAPAGSAGTDFRGFEWHYLDALFNQEWRVLRAHTGYIRAVAFDPDGRRIASVGGQDETVRLWDSGSGREVAVFRGDDSTMCSVAFSVDGNRIASAGMTVRVWDSRTGRELAKFSANEGRFLCVAFSPDGRRIAAATNTGTVRMWDADSYREMAVLRTHALLVMGLAFSPEGKRLATIEFRDYAKVRDFLKFEVHLWNISSGKELWSVDAAEVAVSRPALVHFSESMQLAFSPDGRRIATPGDDMVRVKDAESGRDLLLLVGHRSNVLSVAYSPDGNRIASAGNDRTVRLWDSKTGRELWVMHGHEDSEVSSVAFSPDGHRIASGGTDGTVRVWEPESRFDSISYVKAGGEHQMFSPDNLRLFSLKGDEICITGADTGRVSTVIGRVHRVTGSAESLGLVISPNGRQIAALVTENTVGVWDAESGRNTASLHGHEGTVLSASFSADGRLIATGGEDKTVRLWDAATGNVRLVLRGHGFAVQSVTFSPDGRRIAAGGDDKTVRLWDVATGREQAILRGHEGAIIFVRFSPDSQRIASRAWSEKDSSLRLWDPNSGRELALPRDFKVKSATGALAFSSDGHLMAAGLSDHTIRLLEAESGNEVGRIEGLDGIIEFSPDGRRIVSGGQDGTVRLWDVVSGRELINFLVSERPGDLQSVEALAFSSDGNRIAATVLTNELRVWNGMPRTPAVRSRREALGLARFHLHSAESENDFRNRIEHDPTAAQEIRDLALKLAEGLWQEEAIHRSNSLNSESWDVVKLSDRDNASYREALKKAEAARRLVPNDTDVLNTLVLCHSSNFG